MALLENRGVRKIGAFEILGDGHKMRWARTPIITLLLAMSNFSISHSVFRRLVLQTRKNQGFFGKEFSHTCYMTRIVQDSSGFWYFVQESRKIWNCPGNFKNKVDRFLSPLTVGQRAYVMACCASVRPSIRPCVNFFFKHLLLWNYLSDFDKIS